MELPLVRRADDPLPIAESMMRAHSESPKNVPSGDRAQVLIIGDPAMQTAFAAYVREVFGDVSVYCEETLKAGEKRAARLGSLDLAVIELVSPDSRGNGSLSSFRRSFPRARVVVVSAKNNRSLEIALAAGAAGYIPKTSSRQVIVASLQLVRDGEIFVLPRALTQPWAHAAADEEAALHHRLTQRQLQILRLTLDGRSNAEIAEAIDRREGTVKQHLNRIFKVAGVSKRTELFALARRGRIRENGSPITKVI